MRRRCCGRRRWNTRAAKPASGVPMFGSTVRVAPEKAVLACSSAVREWDSNGTNFGYNPARGATAGEFGHNDFYPVAVAAAQLAGLNGRQTLVAMVDARRNSRPAGRSVRAEESQDRPRGARGDRVGGRVWGGAGRDGRPDRIGDRPGAWPTTFRSARFGTAISFPIPKGRRPRSAPKWPC